VVGRIEPIFSDVARSTAASGAAGVMSAAAVAASGPQRAAAAVVSPPSVLGVDAQEASSRAPALNAATPATMERGFEREVVTFANTLMVLLM
jgi:hypothetical protein